MWAIFPLIPPFHQCLNCFFSQGPELPIDPSSAAQNQLLGECLCHVTSVKIKKMFCIKIKTKRNIPYVQMYHQCIHSADHWCIYFSGAKILSHVTLFLSPWKGLLPGIWAKRIHLQQCLNQCMSDEKHEPRLLIAKASTSMMRYIHWNETKSKEAPWTMATYSFLHVVKTEDNQQRNQTTSFSLRRLRSQTPELKHLKAKETISFIKHCLFHLIRSCHEKKEMMVPKPWRVLRKMPLLHFTTAPPSKLKGDGKSWWNFFLYAHTSSIFVLQITFWVT